MFCSALALLKPKFLMAFLAKLTRRCLPGLSLANELPPART